MQRLVERLQSIGNPDARQIGALTFARFVRDFAGNLAMKTVAKGEPEQEIVANSPRVRAAVKAALTALGDLAKAILDSERAIDISPRVMGRLAAEAREAGHLNKYDPGSLLGAVVALLEREGLDDAAKAVRDVSRTVSKAWQERDK